MPGMLCELLSWGPPRAVQESLFLLASKVTVQAPSYDELVAGGGPDAAAAAPYKGCIVAQGAIFLGTATGSISGVTTPEECCRECAKRLRAANVSERCNVWNHCAEEAGCDYDSPRDATRHSHMRQWQCEWPAQARWGALGLRRLQCGRHS